jgi:hypothetical protein
MSKYVAVLILSLTSFAATANSQVRNNLPIAPQPQIQPISTLAVDSGQSQRLQQVENMRVFAERQAQLRIDTAKLVALTAELKQQVDKTNANVLSLDVVKKAQEIQKLAKSVQDKMKYAY